MSLANTPPRSWPRRLGRLSLMLLAIYVVGVLILLACENMLVYLATPASEGWRQPVDLPAEDVALTSADGTRLHAWWIPNPDSKGTILFCHGQQGNLSFRGKVLRRLQSLGMSVLAIDYPGFGRCEGSPTEQGCYDAADAAYDWLVNEKRVPPSEIMVVGKSLGGGVATDLASRRPCRALVLVMTFTSVPDVASRMFPFVPTRLLMRNRFDNLEKIGRCKCPVYLAHGADDWKIPPSHSEQLCEAVTGPRRCFLMEGVGHGWPCLTDECLADLKRFLSETQSTATSRADP
jgi:uncharacterized protein